MAKRAITTSRFIEDPNHSSSVRAWFRNQDLAVEEVAFDWGAALVFRSVGTLHYQTDGAIDADRSPVVTVHLPKVVRGILWTVGEVQFRSSPLSQFPALAAMRRSFLAWFKAYPLVFDPHPAGEHRFDYYLEGSAQNWGPIRAFPSGQSALQAGRYFVSSGDSEVMLHGLCKKLRLRGVVCDSTD